MRSNLNMPHSLPQRSGGFRDYEKDAPITVLGCMQARLVGKLSPADGSLLRKLCLLPPTHPAKERESARRKKLIRSPKLTGFRCFKNTCKVPSTPLASPLFQRKLCLIQLLQLKKRQSRRSGPCYQITAMSSTITAFVTALYMGCTGNAATADATVKSSSEREGHPMQNIFP